MTKLYFCLTQEIEKTLKNALSPHICGNYEIKRGENGKPYIDGNPVFFSISHSGNEGVILVSDRPCGVDLELMRPRKHGAVFNRFTEREKNEIGGGLTPFLINWVAKEAYIKYLGGSVTMIKRLEYFGRALYCDGVKADCKIEINVTSDAVYAVCTGEDI